MRKTLERILLVEDDEWIRHFLVHVLTTAGYHVDAHGVGLSALNAFRRAPWKYDLIVTDFELPDIDGAQVVSDVLSRRFLPYIICTGASESVPADVLEHGLILKKPLKPEDILQAVERVLVLKRSLEDSTERYA